MTSDHPGGPSFRDIIEEQATDDDGPVFPPVTDGTGDASVDGLTVRLADLHGLGTDEHNALYTGLHDGLLAELNADPSADHDPS
ncbi:hypothetical protein [Arthrobacter sp. CAN_A1]|uniref:hypothetical protein n=1 Tax=Arthrobacter sp. CAN_A1 TaxID=2787717 RepID=UPI0018CB6FB6